MANEFDFLKRPMETWDRYFSILQKEDPHQRFRGIHNGFQTYDHTKAWVTHASLQEYKTYNGIIFREKYKKPILFDESRYEGNIKEGFGNISGNLMAQIFWDATFSGAYQGHGECILGPNEVIWWAKGGVFRGTSPPRIKWFKEIIEKAPPYNELKPNNMMLVKDGEYYLVYCQDTKAKTIELTGTRSYTVESLDLWEMKVTSVGTAPPGPYTFTPPKAYVAYRFTPVP
jgi:sulfur relay (sulfurtransferase) DsrF/TusC family protein